MSNELNYSTGIDFSDRSIQVCEISYKGDKLKSIKIEEVELEQGSVVLGEILNQSDFEEKLNVLLDKAEKNDFKFENIVLSFPEEYLKVITLEVDGEIEEEELEQLIFGKIKEQLLEFSTDWKYEIFEISQEEKKKYLFLGVESEKVLKFTQTIAEFGLDIVAVEPDSFTLLRNIDNQESSVVIDFGESKTIIYFQYEGLLHKRKILPFGAKEIIERIAKQSELSPEKEEIIFRKIGYGKRTNKFQQKVLEEFFQKVNTEVEKFVKDIEKEYSFSIERVFVTGGLTSMIGIKKLLNEKYKYTKVSPIINSDQSDNYLNSLGASLFNVYEGLKVNFLTTDIKELITEQINELLEIREEELVKEELSNLTQKGLKKEDELKKAYLDKWDKKPEKKVSWRLSFKRTSLFQLMFTLIIGLSIVAGTLYKVNSDNLDVTKEQSLYDYDKQVREYFIDKFELDVFVGDQLENVEVASLYGNEVEYIFNYSQEFQVDSEDGKVTDDMIARAGRELEGLARQGYNYEDYIRLEEGKYLIPTAVIFDPAQEGADVEVGIESPTFNYSLRATVRFIEITKENLDRILDQKLTQSLRIDEQIDADKYEISGIEYTLENYDSESGKVVFNVIFESIRNAD